MNHPRQSFCRFGPTLLKNDNCRFSVWAPGAAELSLLLEGSEACPMQRESDGFFSTSVVASNGQHYWFQFADGRRLPDPASRFQPLGVHGPSEVVDTAAFAWTDASWRGVAKSDLIIYELHIGTFTPEGTYCAAIKRLDELLELGITAIELMPLAGAAGGRNWGYDCVNLFAPNTNYGRPQELCALVDAAHARGLAVILDVVYNHFGPEGNYLHPFGGYVSAEHKTAWGDAPNFDGQASRPMRDFVLANVAFWFEAFHLDGLRLDALHCIGDNSEQHIVQEIGQLKQQLQNELDRELHLIAESNVYDPELLRPLDAGGHGFDALWCDDFLHSLFAQLKPGEHHSQRQYVPTDDLMKILERGFVFQGTLKEYRRRIPLEENTPTVPWDSLISSIQHHDFVGNHPEGLRLHQSVGSDAHRAAAALLLLFPTTPMLFMGEEYATDSPFLFFADFGDDHLRVAVEEGRRNEYPQHDWTQSDSPLSAAAFEKSKIGSRDSGCPVTLAWYKQLIKIRKAWRAQGLLERNYLTADFDATSGLLMLNYTNTVSNHCVAIRLASPSTEALPIEVSIAGSKLLTQNAVEDSSGCFELSNYGVLVVEGKILESV